MFIRLKYKFWALQPVFHFYDVYYWFVNVGIIHKDLPEKNMYVNLKKIITKDYEKIDELTKKQIITLIRLNYYRNNENKYDPKIDNIVPYFIGHNTKTFWSYFVDTELLIDNKTGKTIEEKKIIGIITSRPLHVKINSNRQDSEFDVYYVDYLCVNKNWRKKNIAPQLIQTHEYNQSHNNKKISVSLFKREEELTGIIPLTVYKTYCFNMKNWGSPEKLEPRITLLTGDKQNIYYLYNFINEITNFSINTNNPNKDNLEYLFVQCHKTEWIKLAIDNNYYNSDQFIWLDFGIYHIFNNNIDLFNKSIYSLLDKNYNLIRIASIWNPDLIYNTNIHQSICWYFAGGVFGGSKTLLLKFADIMKNKFITYIKEYKSFI